MGADTRTRRHSTTYGWRAKLGLIVPPTNTVNEAEWAIMAPDGVTIHTTRMALHLDTQSDAGQRTLHADLDRAVGDLAAAGLDAIAYGCTAGSMTNPPTALIDHMRRTTAIACVTTAAAIIEALRLLGVFRICLATPYHDALTRHESDFLAANGVETVHAAGLGLGAGGPQEFTAIARTPQEEIYALACATDRPEAQALVIACTDFPAMGLIDRLEDELGKPVVTSNQATFRAALRAAGVMDRLHGYGRLLREH